MGKLGPRLSSRKKAKRWPKGQSSSSNPETTKHREKVAWMFFKDCTGAPGLTAEDLQKHDAIQGIAPQFEKLDIDDERSETYTENTVNTFATNYSNCSNISFNRFLNHFQSNSLLHKEMLAVLSAVAEVIKQNGGTETSTEYFAALMSTLEAVETETSIAATLSLLGMGLKTVPKNVLNIQFDAASNIFLEILSKYASTDDFLIMRHCVHCLSLLLRMQEAATWTNSPTVQVLNAVLAFITHAKPKVRKAAQHGICAILKGSDIMKGENPPLYHPAAPHIAKHCIAQLQLGSEPGGVTSILHILMLLKDITHQLPKMHVKTICEALLKIMGLKNVLITSCCLQTLHGLFVSRPSDNILPSERNGQIITALYDYQPPVTDTQPTLAWLAVMQEAHLNLANTSLRLCAAILPKMFEKCINLWRSERAEIVSGASQTIKVLLQDCIGPICETEELIHKYNNTLDQIIYLMHGALNFIYLEAWYHILHLIALLFQITGKSRNPKLLEIVKTLAKLRDSHSFSSKSDAEYAIGAAIISMGPETVLDIIPLSLPDETVNLKRGWLLPLFKDCITTGSISFFMNELLPLATLSEKKATEPISGKTHEFIAAQVWAILPSICHNAVDVKDNFKSIAKLLGTIISEKKDLRLSVMSALRKLITKAVEDDNKEDIAELAKFAKNYLPLLLNLYVTKLHGTDEEGQRLAAYETIKAYLTITNVELIQELFDRSLIKMKEPDTDCYFKESIQDITRLLIEYTDIDRLQTYYNMCTPCLKDNSKIREQKKAYRFLEDVYGSDKEICKKFVSHHRREIQKLFISTATNVAKPSRRIRLKCLIYLIKSHLQLVKSKFLEAIVPEVVLYLKDLNTKCRTSAYELLNVIAEKLLPDPDHLKGYINMLLVGLAGAQKYCSASLLALSYITYYYNGAIGMEMVKEILDHACALSASPTREITESALSFIKVYVTVMPSPTIALTLKKLIETLCGMNEDCQRHFRQNVRIILTKLIRKYGVETINGMIPASNTMMHKRLKNIRKAEDTKKKNRELKKSKQQNSMVDEEFSAKRRPKSIEDILADSEEEFDGTDNEEPRKSKKRTSRKEAWIQENEESIVDLVDPAAARNVTTTQPGVHDSKTSSSRSKELGFKTAPDGRLIIVDSDEKNDEPQATKVKKAPMFLLHSDSEDDYEDDTPSARTIETIGDRKRKHMDNSDNISVKSRATSKYQAGGSGIHRQLKKRRIEERPGSEYRSLKAAGDVKKKGKPDPYAYVPLTRVMLNRRKKKKNLSKFKNTIKGKKKGAKKGAQAGKKIK